MKFIFNPKQLYNYFKSTIIQLFKEHRSPHSIALGIAIGSLIAVIPIYGFQTLAAIGVSAILAKTKINKGSILLGSQLSIPIFAPFVFALDYAVGNFILNKTWEWVLYNRTIFSEIGKIYIIMFVGSLIVAPIISIIIYIITKHLIYTLKKAM